MLVRYANKDGKLRKVYVLRTERQVTLFDGIKFVASVSTSIKGTNPWTVATADLLKEKPKPTRQYRRGNNQGA